MQCQKIRKSACGNISIRTIPSIDQVLETPNVQAMCEMNSQNRKKQKWRHRMGPINFARVRVALRATKENNEEPSKSEMFIATRTKTGKDLHTDTQVAMAEFQNRQNSGETTDDALRQCLERRSLVELGAMVDQ
ncbi:hypothetical protein KY284_035867 [Solanum tuberosum]|nr:hypothetical protein KY284_035867 [Solanum tuberosum]